MGNTQTNSRASISSVDGTILVEAHGLIADMLSDPSVPPHIVSGLRAVATLLAPPSLTPLPRNKSTRISISLADFANSESDSEENPYLGERTSNLPKKGKRNLSQSVIRRMSMNTWSTTTGATGLPSLVPEPSRKRSTSFRNLNQTNLLQVKSVNALKSRSFSTTSLPVGVLSRVVRTKEVEPLGLGKTSWLRQGKQSVEENDADTEEEAAGGGEKTSYSNRCTPLSFSKAIPRLNLTSDYDSSNESPSGSELTIDDGVTCLPPTVASYSANESAENQQWTKCQVCGALLSKATPDSNESRQLKANLKWPFTDLPPPLTPRFNQKGHYIIDNVCYDLNEIHNNRLLSRIHEWDYPIFELYSQVGDTILSQMSYYVFMQAGLLEAFRIPMTEFLHYFRALENGYHHKPYHDRTHAADVLHGVYYLTSQPIPGFAQIPSESSDSPLHKLHLTSPYPRRQISLSSSPLEETYGIVGANYPALELMALYTAAAMHDFDHPGRTNAFLVATYAPQAILYNDRSVLENHHSAAAWNLFFSKPKYNWLRNLDKAEFKRFRYLVIEFILATDLKRHFEILAEFNAKVNEDDSPGIDWFVEADRLLVMQMTIKLADINGPCKQHSIHLQWTQRIAEEFYEQGDEEAKLGLPISPYMDRKNPQLEKLQESFINHLVAPLCTAYGEAGLLPGVWEYQESDPSSDNGEDNEDKPKTRKVKCIQTEHLQDNYKHWIKRLIEKKTMLETCNRLSSETPIQGSTLEEIAETESEASVELH